MREFCYNKMLLLLLLLLLLESKHISCISPTSFLIAAGGSAPNDVWFPVSKFSDVSCSSPSDCQQHENQFRWLDGTAYDLTPGTAVVDSLVSGENCLAITDDRTLKTADCLLQTRRMFCEFKCGQGKYLSLHAPNYLPTLIE